jgi:hypothetical protein
MTSTIETQDTPGARGYDPVATFDQMLEGTANRPYIYRQLLPQTANWLIRALPIQAISPRIPQQAKQKVTLAVS